MVYLNGDFIAKNKACISVMDRGFLFGDGVYEVIPVYNKKIFRLKPHLDRLQKSLDSVGITNPYSYDKYKEIISTLIEENSNLNQSIYLQITRGVDDKRAHKFNKLIPSIYIESNPLVPKTKQELEQGFSCISQEDIRWSRCDIKSISLLANIMYSKQASDLGAEEVILHRENAITEGATSNVFIIKNNSLFTHPTGKNILSGITRDLVLESAKKCNISINESTFNLNDAYDADELWISSSTREVMPITKLDNKLINNGVIGDAWRCVYNSYQDLKHD